MRTSRLLPVAALTLALTAAGCGSEGSSNNSAVTTLAPGSSVATNTIASGLVLGAGDECPTRDFCLKGLQQTYGLQFKDFRPLGESGGSATKAKLDNGEIQVALLFTSDGDIAAKGWVLLEDDKQLQPSDNVTPVVNNSVVQAYPELATVVDPASAKITTQDLIDLNKATQVDKKDAEAVAREYVAGKGLAPASPAAPKSGPPIIVGSAAFGEAEVLGQVYAAVLEANGYPVERKLKIGSREIYFPALQRGEVNFLPEYAGTLARYLDKSLAASSDPAKTYDALTKALASQGATAFKSAPGQDQNGFVVTKETADKYKLAKLSDLAKPAS